MIWVLLILFSIQIMFAYLYRYRTNDKYNASNIDWPKVSIVICGKNEAQNFQQNLQSVLSQHYPHNDWELVVVNDASTDESSQILQNYKKVNKQLNIVEIGLDATRTLPGKKFALLQGLKAAKYEAVLLTDADCKPFDNLWLQTMAQTFALKKQSTQSKSVFVLGYGAYEKASGLLNRFVRWETVHTFIQYASWSKMGLPYMAVGRNLMYAKTPVLELIEKDKTFLETFAATASGDDDLIVSALANSENTVIEESLASQTVSKAPKTWSAWWKQKTRHVSSGKYYAPVVKYGLGLYAITAFFFWVLAALLLVISEGQIQIITLILVGIKILAYWLNAMVWNKHLQNAPVSAFYPFGEWMWLLYNFAISPFIFWKNKKQWK